MQKFLKYKRIYFVALLPLSFLLTYIAKLDPYFTEKYFSAGYYPILAQSVSYITSLVPFSVAEFCLIFGVPLIIFYILYNSYKAYKKPDLSRDIFLKFFSGLIAGVSVFSFVFTVTCGVNYHRLPFSYYSQLDIIPSSSKELELLCIALVDKANSLRELVSEDENGVMKLTDDSIYDTAKKAQHIFSNVSKDYPVLDGKYAKPKPVMLSRGMSHLQITGVFTPYTFESNVNIDIPMYSIPSTMCHEQIHLRGFMREDEANYISYLACTKSDDIEFQYSGTMLALIYSMNSLYSSDYEAFERIYYTYSDGVNRDLKYNSEYWKSFDGKIGKTYDKLNDTYLKANSQPDGVKSYGRMIDLLLAQFRKNDYQL